MGCRQAFLGLFCQISTFLSGRSSAIIHAPFAIDFCVANLSTCSNVLCAS